MNVLRIISLLLAVMLFSESGYTQTNWTYETFRDTRIVNGHSIESNGTGMGKFIISHRFGRVNTGFNEFFGLDQANMRIGLDYGVTDQIDIGFGRSGNENTFDGFVKWKLLSQCSGDKNIPVTASLMLGAAIKAQPWTVDTNDYLFSHRLYYTSQLLIARKFSDRFSLQIMPSLLHRNLVDEPTESNDVIALGIAPKFQVNKSLAITAEYYYILPDQLLTGYYSPLSFGVDISTKGHVFQIHLSNSRGMTERFFIGETDGLWTDGDIHLGFNITRDYRVKGRKKR